MLPKSLLPHFPPTVIADRIAQSEHGVHILALPVHPSPFETSLDHVFLGTLHHARANRPAVTSELRVVHLCLSFPQVVELGGDFFLLGKIVFQAISHAEQRSGTSMFEDMQTAVQYLCRKLLVS